MLETIYPLNFRGAASGRSSGAEMVSFFFLQAGPPGGLGGVRVGHMTPGGMVRPASGTGWFVREGSITHKAIHKVASELHSWKGWREGAELSWTEAV